MIIFKKQSGLATAIIILIVVVLLSAWGVGYYFYLSRDKALRDKTKEISSKIKSADLVTVKPVVEDKLSKWIDEWQEIMPEFNISIFRNVSEKTITPNVEYTYDPEKQNKLREILYVYSPNGRKFIDPYVYMHLYKDNGRLRPAFDIDSAITLVDLESKKWKRLLSCGTPCIFNDVVWVDDNTFVVVGNTEYYPSSGEGRCTVSTKCTYVATLHIFDLAKNKVILYYGPESEIRPRFDLRDKFPNIDFD